jgi:hypothetical protein
VEHPDDPVVTLTMILLSMAESINLKFVGVKGEVASPQAQLHWQFFPEHVEQN